MLRILIIGATSAIAEATARRYAKHGARFFLCARNAERLNALAADLAVRGASNVITEIMDANDFNQHEVVIDKAIAEIQGVDIALIAHGTLDNQQTCERDFAAAMTALNTNAISVISLLTHLANRFEAQKHGSIAVISSVAGDRGRKSNYVYGTAKSAVSTFMQGLRNRLHASGVHVLTVKPGFVDTPMTAGIRKGLLWAQPESIATGIESAIARKCEIVYLPFWWRFIMAVVRLIPESVFKRLSL
jgi:decaprenylphospho-beta-D-erythro-pentofuranosid-2-ulose 2-reductase